MSLADIQNDAAALPRTAEALLIDTPAPATRIIRDAGAHAYPLSTPANQTTAPHALDGLPVRFNLPIGFGLRVGIAGHRPPSLHARLRKLEAELTADPLEVQDLQARVDWQNATRVGAVLALASTALMVWLLMGGAR